MNGKERFILRDYTLEDFGQVDELWHQTGMNTPGRGDTAVVISATLDHGGRLRLLVEEENGRIVGSSWLTHDARRLYLHHFAILPSFQGHGLARKLLADSLLIARAIGLQVKLEVHRENVRAVNLYRRAGFAPLGAYDVYIIRDPTKIDVDGSHFI